MTDRPTADSSPYLAALARRVLVFDGAMGTSLQAFEPTADDFGGADLEGWIDGLVLNAPHLVRAVHRGFLEAGCDVVETCTFQAAPMRVAEWGGGRFVDRAEELNAVAAQLAREEAAAFATAERPRFVAGSIGPSGFLPSSDDPSLGRITFEELVETFRVQARGLVAGGADLLIIETQQDILETKAVMFGARRAFADLGRAIPIQAQVSLDVSGRMLLGTDIGAVLAILEGLRADVVGLNCSTGPEHMREPVRWLTSHTRLPVSCVPNAGLPLNVDGRTCYPLEPAPMADELARFVRESGVNAVGGCCGTIPEHIRELASRVAGMAPRPRDDVDDEPRLASAIRSVTLRQQPAPLLIGERVNAQGSRRMKELLLADDYDGILSIARDQVESGAHAIDVQVALTERTDEAGQMRTLTKKLQMSIEPPLVCDTTEVDVVRAFLETYPGRAVVNSVNLEDGRTRMDSYLPLVRDHGAAVIALTIDRDEPVGGMAKTRHHKLLVAQRITEIAVGEVGLAPHQLLFDCLTFTLATGQEEFLDSAVETIEGIRAVKREIPGVLTTLGLSNVSFGFAPAARRALNSVFLHHCVDAGLDTVIINPAHVTPMAEIPAAERELAEDLVFNRRPDATQRFIEHYTSGGGAAARPGSTQADPFEGLEPPERIHQQILHRRKDGIEEQIDLALADRTPVGVINEILLPAMKDVGDRFGAGELILPFVLQSAEVMKRAVAHVEQFLDRQDGVSKGTVVLATVYGDVHDIGKNLVNTILSNNGFTVHDLGKQVPVNTIIDKAVEVNADAIGLSALLVSTSKQMPACLRELDDRGLTFPVIVGGAAINRAFGRRILYLEPDRVYSPGVFYCKDAFEGLETVDALVDPERGPALVTRVREEAETHRTREAQRSAAAPAANGAAPRARSDTRTDAPIPVPPFWGPRTLGSISVDDVATCIDRNSLFKMSWQFKGIRDPQRWAELLRTELEPRLELSLREAHEDGYLHMQGVYGYYPALAEGDTIVLHDPADRERVIGRLEFPRQQAQNRLCLADYVRPRELAAPGEYDVVALQVVTAGPQASERSNALQRSGDYDAMLRVHGFSTQMAEATAEWLHRRINAELGIPREQGRRYSWGYPACPELEDHTTVFAVLPAAEIGVTLTDGFQLVPEQSTCAIVLHHPQARYFAVYTATSASTQGADEGMQGAPEEAPGAVSGTPPSASR
ncbi:MAG TPA: methionine synthase [Candidatus Dormibacteraeota bacterium]|nr:methionine synthase [Candidatus Dormibacteraeota bacterium]